MIGPDFNLGLCHSMYSVILKFIDSLLCVWNIPKDPIPMTSLPFVGGTILQMEKLRLREGYSPKAGQ